MKIIGLTGFAKSGKSTAAEVLKRMGGHEVAFAKHLKDVCAITFGVPRTHFDDQEYKELEFKSPILMKPRDIGDVLDMFEVPKRLHPEAMLTHGDRYLRSPRHIAQYIGTDVLRAVDKNIHVEMAFKLNNKNTADFLICSDVRFLNEMESVHRHGGIVLGISRKLATPRNLNMLHGSETEIPNLINLSDAVVDNEYSVDDFKAHVSMTVSNYFGK